MNMYAKKSSFVENGKISCQCVTIRPGTQDAEIDQLKKAIMYHR